MNGTLISKSAVGVSLTCYFYSNSSTCYIIIVVVACASKVTRKKNSRSQAKTTRKRKNTRKSSHHPTAAPHRGHGKNEKCTTRSSLQLKLFKGTCYTWCRRPVFSGTSRSLHFGLVSYGSQCRGLQPTGQAGGSYTILWYSC